MKRWGMAIAFLSALVSVTVAGACLRSQIRAEEDDPEPSEDVAIDETNFPDPNFRYYVLSVCDTNKNKDLDPSEIQQTKSISITYKYGSMYSLMGVEYFTCLESLECENLQLKNLDVSSNKNLEKLFCSHNDFKTINLSNCTKLLDAINSGELKLENNDEQYVVTDVLRIDSSVQTTPQLFDPLPEPIEGEDIPIDMWHFPDEIFRKLVTYYDVDGDGMLSKEERLNATDEDGRHAFYLMGNDERFDIPYICTLRGIEYFPLLEYLEVAQYCLRTMDLSANTELMELYCVATSLSTLDLSNNTHLDKVTIRGCRDLTTLDLGNNPSLTKVLLRNNRLTKFDVSNCSRLTYLDCFYNQLASLDVSGCTSLTNLNCSSNQLKNLDVSGCTSLTDLNCSSNQLKDLDVSTNDNLSVLYCSENLLTSLNVSNNGKLTTLFCKKNQLANLDVSSNVGLRELYCSENGLTSLDVSKNPLLYILDCSSNQLTSLDVRENAKLFDLSCKKNQLSHLDLSRNVSLVGLLCSFNNFGQLDLSNCKTLLGQIAYLGGRFTSDGKQFISYDTDEDAPDLIMYFEIDSYVWTNPLLFDPIDPIITPTPAPTKNPTKAPTKTPTKEPTHGPTPTPKAPTQGPTVTPTPTNTPTPTQGPTPTPKTPTQGPTKTPTKNPTISPTPTKAPVKDPTFEDFVERLYTVALGRASEPEGKAFWIKQVVEEGKTGADCARFFLLDADEFMKRGLSVEDFVETLYATFFDRESDAAGKKGWVDAIKSGKKTRAEVVNDFIESTEWCNVCATYGVKSGAKWHKATFASKNAKDFATRLYTCCLGRDPEEGGLKYWSLALTNLEQTGCSAAKLFFTSDEFVGFKLKDEEYIKRLYTTFMGREPAASEVSYWMGEIKKGTQTKYSVMQFFGQSPEFTEICKKYGINRGEI